MIIHIDSQEVEEKIMKEEINVIGIKIILLYIFMMKLTRF